MSEKMIHTLRAKGVEDTLRITISEDVDEYLTHMCANDPARHLEETKQAFAIEAHWLCKALHTHLPGGLFDALLGAMLHAKATVFHVPHKQETG